MAAWETEALWLDLVGWLPSYLHWYGLAMRGPVLRGTTGSLAALGAMWLARRRRCVDAQQSRKTLPSK